MSFSRHGKATSLRWSRRLDRRSGGTTDRGVRRPGAFVMQIWVDADACPGEIKELLYRTAKRLKIKLTLVRAANSTPRGATARRVRRCAPGIGSMALSWRVPCFLHTGGRWREHPFLNQCLTVDQAVPQVDFE